MSDRAIRLRAESVRLAVILNQTKDLAIAASQLAPELDVRANLKRFPAIIVAAITLYYKGRLMGQPRTLSELRHHVKCRRGVLAKCFRRVARASGIRLTLIHPLDIHQRICSDLCLREEEIEKVRIRLHELHERGVLYNYSPDTVVGAVINEQCGLSVPFVRKVVYSNDTSLYEAVSILRNRGQIRD